MTPVHSGRVPLAPPVLTPCKPASKSRGPFTIPRLHRLIQRVHNSASRICQMGFQYHLQFVEHGFAFVDGGHLLENSLFVQLAPTPNVLNSSSQSWLVQSANNSG